MDITIQTNSYIYMITFLLFMFIENYISLVYILFTSMVVNQYDIKPA